MFSNPMHFDRDESGNSMMEQLYLRTSPVTLGPVTTLIEAGRGSGLYSGLLPGVPQRSKPQGELLLPSECLSTGLRGTVRPEVVGK
jgi:hypothetical protein